MRRKINVTRDIIFDERFEDDNNRTSSRPNRESTENPDHHQKSREVQNQNQSTPEQERQSNLSAKNRDYKPPDLQALGNDDVQNALKEISRAASRIANIRTEELRRSTREGKRPERYDQDPKYARVAILEPENFHDAMSREDSKEWEKAMNVEYNSLLVNNTWKIVDLLPNRKTIRCRWIYKIKHRANGKIDRYKARLVAKGYSQTKGIDYFETFAPVVKFNSICILLALVAQHDLDVVPMWKPKL